MKYIFIVLLSLNIFINCQTPDNEAIEQQSTIKLKISFSNQAPMDTVYLSLYPLNGYVSTNFGYKDKSRDSSLYSFSITDSVFSFSINEGYYSLVASAFGYEPVNEALFIPDSSVNIDMMINFMPRGLGTDDFENINIYGDFCDWNFMRGKALTKQNDIWKLEDRSFLKPGSKYILFLGETRDYYDLNNNKYTINRKKGTFNSVYHGNEIIFDPSQYEYPLRESIVHFSGFNKQIDFSNLIRELQKFNTIRGIIRLLEMDDSERDSTFHSLELEYAEKYDQILVHQKIRYLSQFHPFRKELNKIISSKKSEEELRQFYSSSLYRSYFNEMMPLIQRIDPSSDFYKSITSLDILNLDEAIKYAPELMEDYMPKQEVQTNLGIHEDLFVSYLDSLENQGVPKMEGAHLLWFIAGYYQRENKYQEVKRILARLSLKYPDSGYDELIQKQFSNLSMNVGNTVPEINLATSEGDSIKSSDFKNKFIFLYFWVGACGFSRRELPNVNRLYHSLPPDEFQLVGITETNSGDTKWIEEGYSLDFPNCLVSEDVLLEYGIIAYPTSYLLAPDGKIIDKDLRGENLTEKVKEKIEQYKKNQ